MPVVKLRLVSLAATVGLGVLAINVIAQAPKDKPTAARDRVTLAKQIYLDRLLNDLERQLSPPRPDPMDAEARFIFKEDLAEYLHAWSVRWMESEISGSATQDDRVAAAGAHLERMKSIESGTVLKKELTGHPSVDHKTKEDFISAVTIAQLKKELPDMAEVIKQY